MKRIIIGSLVILFILTFSLSIIGYTKKEVHAQVVQSSTERYSDDLYNTISGFNEFILYTEKKARERNISHNSKEFVILIDSVLKERFYHGYSHYSLSNNYIAYLAGKIFWNHLSSIVLPDDLLQYKHAACSQQAIVFMEILNHYGFDTRKIELKNHFGFEVFYNNKWHFYDSHKEISPVNEEFLPVDSLINNPLNLSLAYQKNNIKIDYLIQVFDKKYVSYGKVNEMPAKNMKSFHKLSKFASNYAWLFILCILVFISLFKDQ